MSLRKHHHPGLSRSAQVLERWLIIGIAVLMVITLAVLARVIGLGNQREDELALSMVDQAIASQNQRVRLIADTYVWSLEEEAERFLQGGPVQDSALIARWLPLMRSRHAVSAIGLADDQGNEWTLRHEGGLWRFTATRRQGRTARSTVRQWAVNRGQVPAADSMAAPPDPRAADWYSRAVENRRDGPVWSDGHRPDGGADLDLSMLVRDGARDGTLHVLRFGVNTGMMFASGLEWQSEIHGAVLNSNWEFLNATDTGSIGQLWKEAIADLHPDLSSRPRRIEAHGKPWLCRIAPLYLNGTQFYSGVLVGSGGIEHWGEQRRTALRSVIALLLLLSLLITLVFAQSRGADRKAKRQARRSDMQARHLAKAIGEREELDREVHHRVKNNLQVVSSLLNLQAQRIPDEGARKEFTRGKRRIDSMALVHHKLYRQTDLSAVDLGVFLKDIVAAMAAMFEPQSRAVSHSVDANGIRCDADTGIQLGMLVCELIANCYQHAFPYPTGGHISITVEPQEDGNYKLVVKDNGQGMGPAATQGPHLGLEVVEALAEQLDGSYRASNDGGTRAEVIFRMGTRA